MNSNKARKTHQHIPDMLHIAAHDPTPSSRAPRVSEAALRILDDEGRGGGQWALVAFDWGAGESMR